jgi:hypothetical protein
VTMALKDITQQELEKCSQQWQHRWAKRIAAQRVHFENGSAQ